MLNSDILLIIWLIIFIFMQLLFSSDKKDIICQLIENFSYLTKEDVDVWTQLWYEKSFVWSITVK